MPQMRYLLGMLPVCGRLSGRGGESRYAAQTHGSRSGLGERSLVEGEIAEKIGYNDNSYFSNAFKAQTGFTPGQYKKGGGK